MTTRKSTVLGAVIAALAARFGEFNAAQAQTTTGLQDFAARYGNDPKPLNGSRNGQRRKSGVAAAKRAKAKRRNIRARSSKRARRSA